MILITCSTIIPKIVFDNDRILLSKTNLKDREEMLYEVIIKIS